jgi:hypothetical protein
MGEKERKTAPEATALPSELAKTASRELADKEMEQVSAGGPTATQCLGAPAPAGPTVYYNQNELGLGRELGIGIGCAASSTAVKPP